MDTFENKTAVAFLLFFQVVMEKLLTELKSNLEFDEKYAEGIKEDGVIFYKAECQMQGDT